MKVLLSAPIRRHQSAAEGLRHSENPQQPQQQLNTQLQLQLKIQLQIQIQMHTHRYKYRYKWSSSCRARYAHRQCRLLAGLFG